MSTSELQTFAKLAGLSTADEARIASAGVGDKVSEYLAYARKRPTVAPALGQALLGLVGQQTPTSAPPLPEAPPAIAETYSYANVGGVPTHGAWTIETARNAGAVSVWRPGLAAWLDVPAVSAPSRNAAPMVGGFYVPWPESVNVSKKNGKSYVNLRGSLRAGRAGTIGIELDMLRAIIGNDSAAIRQQILAEVERLAT